MIPAKVFDKVPCNAKPTTRPVIPAPVNIDVKALPKFIIANDKNNASSTTTTADVLAIRLLIDFWLTRLEANLYTYLLVYFAIKKAVTITIIANAIFGIFDIKASSQEFSLSVRFANAVLN